jgi:N-methylhydantoinase A/oxoprolinase/acetone carboxylase beta subunit
VEQYDTTFLILPGMQARVDEYLLLITELTNVK